MAYEIEVYELAPDETCGCYFCMEQNDYAQYKRGEAYLAGASHSPCDGNAHYICKEHLDREAVIYDVHNEPVKGRD